MDVVTSKGIDWQREKWQSGLGSKFIHQGEKNAAKYADEVIVLSKGVQDYFKETYGRETHFMYNMIEDVAAIGAVPLTPYGTPSTTEVPDAIEPYLNDHDVMLLENHGALTVGSDVITAYYRMESLELWAKITINAIILGGSYDIDRKNIDKLINLRSYYKITGKHPGYRKFERREKGEPTDK